jgi:hypothetical protein
MTASILTPAAKPRTFVYIDGFNLYYGALKEAAHKVAAPKVQDRPGCRGIF